jgi:outer membrane protein TolC
MSRVKTAYQKLTTDYEEITVLERTRDIVREMLRVTEVRYATGSAEQQDLFKAQTQISALELRMERLRQDIRSREAELNALLARQPETPLGRPSPIPSPPAWTSTPEELLKDAQANAPMLRRDRKMIERDELSVNLARKDFLPDYALSGGYFNMASMPAMYQFRLDLKLPLFNREKLRAGVAEQVASLSASRRGYEAAEQNIAYRIRDDWEMANTSRRLMAMYQDTLIPQARLTLESSLPSYQTGKIEFLSLLNNAMAVLEYENGLLEERQNYHLALIRLEEMTGVELLEVGQ